MIGLRRGLRWLRDKLLSKVQHFIIQIIAAGPVPRHVAFIMDGNRRYARKRHQKVQQGHVDGFGALRRVSLLPQPFIELQMMSPFRC